VVKKDLIENQYYDKATFDRLNEETPGDEAKRTGFETLGIQYKITKDLRKSKK